jgi:hypothetical protein
MLTFNDVRDIKKRLKGYVVTSLDKGGKTIQVLCPTKLIGVGLTDFVLNEPNLELRDMTEREALDSIETIYHACGLTTYFPFKQKALPTIKLDPKFKDPNSKFRMITSYYRFPMKQLLRYVGKALRFMLLAVHEHRKMESFTLFRLCDFKSRISQLKSMPNKKYLQVWQTDVKSMFTNLSKNGVLHKIEALIGMYSNIYRGKPNGITVLRTFPHSCFKGTSLALDNTVDLPFDLIRRVVLWDLNATYSRFGDLVVFQKEGLPIGGICSSIYADIQCSFDENELFSKANLDSSKFLCIRQIDDLLILAEDETTKNTITSSYDKGLTLESELVKSSTNESGTVSYKLSYIGLDLTFKDGKVRSKVSNVNLPAIAATGRQIKPRYAPVSSYRTVAFYSQTIMTALDRIYDFSIGSVQIRMALQGLYYEMMSINYSSALFKTTLRKFIGRRVRKERSKTWLSTLASLQ